MIQLVDSLIVYKFDSLNVQDFCTIVVRCLLKSLPKSVVKWRFLTMAIKKKTNINLFTLSNQIQTFQGGNASISKKCEAKMYRKLQKSKSFGRFWILTVDCVICVTVFTLIFFFLNLCTNRFFLHLKSSLFFFSVCSHFSNVLSV